MIIEPRFKTFMGVLACLAISGAARAGPPFVTDDPEPPEYQTWEINYAFESSHNIHQTNGALPSIDANYGAAPAVQLHLQPQAAFHSEAGTTYGMGDSEIGIKYRLTPEPEGEQAWMISVYPLYEIPTGNQRRGLGSGSSSIYLPLWLQTKRGPWTTYGGAGYWINSGNGTRNAWSGGWVALYQWTESLQFGAEAYARGADTLDQRSTVGFNFGGTLELAKNYSLLFSAGRGIKNVAQSNQTSAYLGLQIIYGH